MQTNTKYVLVVGGNSKIAKVIVPTLLDAGFGVYCVQRSHDDSKTDPRAEVVLVDDVKEFESLQEQLFKLNHVNFSGLLYFVSTYENDSTGINFMQQLDEDLRVNAYALGIIAKTIKLTDKSKIIAFGDAGTEHPKKGYLSYTLSKLALESIITSLAVELAPNTSTLLLRLGPTLTDTDPKGTYYKRALLDDANPVLGLAELVTFILSNNLHITGTSIDYDGGTYLQRL